MITKILLVDDEPYLTELIAMALSELKFEVFVANSGTEAISNFYESGDRFDLLITDAIMPHLSGYELVKKIIDFDKNFSKVIFITGLSELPLEATNLEKMNLKMEVLLKPFLISELVELIFKMNKQ